MEIELGVLLMLITFGTGIFAVFDAARPLGRTPGPGRTGGLGAHRHDISFLVVPPPLIGGSSAEALGLPRHPVGHPGHHHPAGLVRETEPGGHFAQPPAAAVAPVVVADPANLPAGGDDRLVHSTTGGRRVKSA